MERGRQVALMGGILGSIYASVALFSYDPMDPGWFRSSASGGGLMEVRNAAGPLGADVADVLYQLFGYGAWGVLGLGGLAAIRLAGRRVGGVGRVLSAAGVIGAGLGIVGLISPEVGAGGFLPAGALGGALASGLSGMVGVAGAWIVLGGSLLASATFALRLDWERYAGGALGGVERAIPVAGRFGVKAGRRAVDGVVTVGARVVENVRRSREATEDLMPADWDDQDGSQWDGASQAASVAVAPEQPAPSRRVSHRAEPAVGPVPRPTIAPRDLTLGIGSLAVGTRSGVPVAATHVGQRELVEVEWESTVASVCPAADDPARRTRPSVAAGTRADPVSVGFVPGTRADPVSADDIEGAPRGAASGGRRAHALDQAPGLVAQAHDRSPASTSPVDLRDAPARDRGSLFDAPSAPRRAAVAEPKPPVAASAEAAVPPSRAVAPIDAADPAFRKPAPALRSLSGLSGGSSARLEKGNLVSGGSFDEGAVVVKDMGRAGFELPHLGLLDVHERSVARVDEAELRELGALLVEKLADFGIQGEVTAIRPGPVITTFEYLPAPGVKLSKIASLEDDIAMALRALRVRIVAPIPGKGVVGIEVPNKKRQIVWVRDILASDTFRRGKYALPLALGKSVEGEPELADLSKAPHLLVAGTTGSGKSVGVNAMLLSLLFTMTPEELRLILIDPKTLEFKLYEDIPHLLHPVVTDPRLANAALKWACEEMEERYRLLARWKTRNIKSYNEKVEAELEDWSPGKAQAYAPPDWPKHEPPPPPRKLPYIVVVIDELADLMMVAAKEVEISIARIAQKARAAGIHLIVATQRPERTVVTGIIKSNMPSRIAFQVRSKIDGRIILDQNGAEALLGKGDMLFLPPGVSELMRCHGAFVSDEEVERVTDFLRAQRPPSYEAQICLEDDDDGEFDLDEDDYDPLYDLAVAYVVQAGKASTSMVQRQFKIGYNRAARIVEVMEREGVVGAADGARPRKILVSQGA